MTESVVIRPAALGDVEAMTRVEQASWRGLAASREELESRVRTFAAGQLVAERDGTIVALISTQRLAREFFEQKPVTHERLTDHGRIAQSHDPRGAIFQLIGVAVDPSERGAGLGRTLVNHALAFARSQPGVERIVGFTRPIGFYRFPALSLERYLQLRDASGEPIDAVVSMHTGNGARIVSVQPAYRPSDHETRGYAVLIEYSVA